MLFGMIPRFNCADVVLRAGGQFDVVIELEIAINPSDEAEQALDLFTNLFFGDEAVCVILGQLPHAR